MLSGLAWASKMAMQGESWCWEFLQPFPVRMHAAYVLRRLKHLHDHECHIVTDWFPQWWVPSCRSNSLSSASLSKIRSHWTMTKAHSVLPGNPLLTYLKYVGWKFQMLLKETKLSGLHLFNVHHWTPRVSGYFSIGKATCHVVRHSMEVVGRSWTVFRKNRPTAP